MEEPQETTVESVENVRTSSQASQKTPDRRALRPKSARYGCRPSNIVLCEEVIGDDFGPTESRHGRENCSLPAAEAKSVQTDMLEDAMVTSLRIDDAPPADGTQRKGGYKGSRTPHGNRSTAGVARRQRSVEVRSNGYSSPTEVDDLPVFQPRRCEETAHVPYEVVLNASSQKVLDRLKDRQRALSGVTATGKLLGTPEAASGTLYGSKKLQPIYSSRLGYRQK